MKESNKRIRRVAEEIADQMIKVAAKYAKKWGRTSGVGFVTTYGTTSEGVIVKGREQLVKYLEKQKQNLISIIENNGVATKGVLKGKTFDLTDGDPEDIVFDIFLGNMFRLGLAVAASSKNGEKKLFDVFKKPENFRVDDVIIKSKENGGISSEISAIARFTSTNLKPAFQQGVAGWEKLFKEMDKAAELTEKEKLIDDSNGVLDERKNDTGKILDIDCAEEGSPKYREHLIRERNKSLIRKKKESATSLSCEVCGFDFKKFYGDLGKDYCEVHHKIPLSKLNESAKTELADLAIVCSNCHRMLHRKRDDVFTIAELKKKIKKKIR